MACGHYPEDEDWFIDALRREAHAAALRLRNHACLAFWTGDNENAEWGDENRTDFPGYRSATFGIEPVISRLDPERYFFPSSPYGGNRYSSATRGTTHGTNYMFPMFVYIDETDMSDYRKFFSQFIPANERVITIEDTLEIRYAKTNPGKDCIEMKVSEEGFGYAEAIKSCLRLNPKWIMLSEARSKEVKYLLESWSTGVRGMTTLHTDDVRNVPDRILNMLENRADSDRMENDIFQALDVGVLVRKRIGNKGVAIRYLDQVCFYMREKGQNHTEMVVFDGNRILENLPEPVIRLFRRAGIEEPFYSSTLEAILLAGQRENGDRDIESSGKGGL
jgi:hypothetical protein